MGEKMHSSSPSSYDGKLGKLALSEAGAWWQGGQTGRLDTIHETVVPTCRHRVTLCEHNTKVCMISNEKYVSRPLDKSTGLMRSRFV